MFGWLKRCRAIARDEVPADLAELKRVYPAINAASGEFLSSFGPSFTGTADGHIGTDVAGAASVAGAMLLRAVVSDLDRYDAGQVLLSDVHDSQSQLLRFMAVVARGMGLNPDKGWTDPIPSEHQSLFEVPELVGKLQNPLEQVAFRGSVAKKFQAHIAALTAIKLVAAGHQMGILDQDAGKALAAYYLVAGSKTVPPAIDATG